MGGVVSLGAGRGRPRLRRLGWSYGEIRRLASTDPEFTRTYVKPAGAGHGKNNCGRRPSRRPAQEYGCVAHHDGVDRRDRRRGVRQTGYDREC